MIDGFGFAEWNGGQKKEEEEEEVVGMAGGENEYDLFIFSHFFQTMVRCLCYAYINKQIHLFID